MAEPLFELKNASVHAGERALIRNVSLTVHANERVAILGANGAGKTSLLRALHGLVPLTEGSLNHIPAAQQTMVFQRPALLRTTVLENVRFVLRAQGQSNETQRARQALAACGLKEVERQQARTLSGGEQQRLALACVWALRPRVLFADEPTASLDRHAVVAVETLLTQIHTQGAALVLITHSLGQAKRLSQRILFLDDGELIEDSPTNEFFTRPRTASAAQFLEGET